MEWELLTVSVERDVAKLLRVSNIHTPQYFSILNIELPNSRLAQEATAFAKKELDEIMFNHSQRVFLLGRILSQDQFPEWKINHEDYFLTFILHDVGVASRYHLTTSMSFELKVAMASHQFIVEKNGPRRRQIQWLRQSIDTLIMWMARSNLLDSCYSWQPTWISLALTRTCTTRKPSTTLFSNGRERSLIIILQIWWRWRWNTSQVVTSPSLAVALLLKSEIMLLWPSMMIKYKVLYCGDVSNDASVQYVL